MEREVSVWGKRFTISVYKRSATVWVAVGDYNGERIEVTSRSPSSAAASWQAAAKYKGNL